MSMMLTNDCGSGSPSVDGFQSGGMTYCTVHTFPMDFGCATVETLDLGWMFHNLTRFRAVASCPQTLLRDDHTSASLLPPVYGSIYILDVRGAWYTLRTATLQ